MKGSLNILRKNNKKITVKQSDIEEALKNGNEVGKKYLEKGLINSALIELHNCFCIVHKETTNLNFIDKSSLKKINYF